jgi:two-component system, NarL family, response regulator LiaR
MNKERPIKVMIVDDHAVVRSGLSAFMMAYDDLELVGEAGGGKEAIGSCRENAPDVVLMDLVMPEMDGAQTTEEILKMCPDIKVIALTSFPEEDLVQKALKAGAISYLLKNVSGDELADAIRAAYAGKATLAPEATEALIHSATKPPAPGQDLTDRELEILGLMAKGVNNDTIARELFISASTVKFHVSNVLMKLGSATRTEAVAIALKNNLVGRK